MGKIRQGILGGFSGKVANVVGSSWKGIAVMKSLPLSVANPRTSGQVAQRNKFANTVAFAVLILSTIIKPLWDRFAQRQSGFNAFISANIDNFEDSVPMPKGNLVLSRGQMGSINPTAITINPGNNDVQVNWDEELSPPMSLPDDVPFCVVYNQDQDDYAIASGSLLEKREGGSIFMGSKPFWNAGETAQAWLAFRRADGTVVSNTGFLDDVLTTNA